MKLLVFGGGGELGSALVGAAAPDMELRALTHLEADVTRLADVYREIDLFRPDVVVNCAGLLRGAEATPLEFVATNALAPYHVAAACETYSARMVQISTDCVFSGDNRRRWYMPADPPDPTDIYGRSKALGEVKASHVAVIRTSFMGRSSRLWQWLEDAARRGEESVQGWYYQMWSGSTSRAVAETLVDLLTGDEIVYGETIHLATEEPISKFDAVKALAAHCRLPLTVYPVDVPRGNMALCPTVVLPSFAEALAREIDTMTPTG